jgi:hypothetical protein
MRQVSFKPKMMLQLCGGGCFAGRGNDTVNLPRLVIAETYAAKNGHRQVMSQVSVGNFVAGRSLLQRRVEYEVDYLFGKLLALRARCQQEASAGLQVINKSTQMDAAWVTSENLLNTIAYNARRMSSSIRCRR